MKTIVVTGYKPMELGIFKNDDPKVDIIKTAIKKRLVALIDEGLQWVVISGQMGVELWTGEVILGLKEEYDINLAVLPPFSNQQSRWPDAMQRAYEVIIEQCDFYKEIYEKEYEGPYQFRARDQFFVEHSDGCLMLYDEDTQGSPQYFLKLIKKYREHHAYELLFITPLDLDETVEEMRMTNPDYWSQ
ncbi:UPF0398 protein YpsA [Halobacillus andaensis]|uniref:UPF0398 protein GCM10010954_05210 n=1 Tax=Halobacillus andaensis TaxID=1176239 RepID=A0A917AYG7_HALAA|nr:DUF1273 domain-containing protein [Halobacillus andaensis]MBP2003310.1 putative phage-like protein YoqJ [Halobacillus andaensis]GGF09704.1 UPF0398 protein YpsA [Halobacillus andaensis]